MLQLIFYYLKQPPILIGVLVVGYLLYGATTSGLIANTQPDELSLHVRKLCHPNASAAELQSLPVDDITDCARQLRETRAMLDNL